MFEKIRAEIDKAVLEAFKAAIKVIKEWIEEAVKEYDKLLERGLEITDKGTLDLMADLERVHEAIQKAEPTVQPVPTNDPAPMTEPEATEPSPEPPAIGEPESTPEAQP